jgi:hypothetical protein
MVSSLSTAQSCHHLLPAAAEEKPCSSFTPGSFTPAAGMPYPQNLQTAQEVEAVVRQHGAVPATIAIIAGQCCIGLDAQQLGYVARQGQKVRKVSRRCAATGCRCLQQADVASGSCIGKWPVAAALTAAVEVALTPQHALAPASAQGVLFAGSPQAAALSAGPPRNTQQQCSTRQSLLCVLTVVAPLRCCALAGF